MQKTNQPLINLRQTIITVFLCRVLKTTPRQDLTKWVGQTVILVISISFHKRTVTSHVVSKYLIYSWEDCIFRCHLLYRAIFTTCLMERCRPKWTLFTCRSTTCLLWRASVLGITLTRDSVITVKCIHFLSLIRKAHRLNNRWNKQLFIQQQQQQQQQQQACHPQQKPTLLGRWIIRKHLIIKSSAIFYLCNMSFCQCSVLASRFWTCR